MNAEDKKESPQWPCQWMYEPGWDEQPIVQDLAKVKGMNLVLARTTIQSMGKNICLNVDEVGYVKDRQAWNAWLQKSAHRIQGIRGHAWAVKFLHGFASELKSLTHLQLTGNFNDTTQAQFFSLFNGLPSPDRLLFLEIGNVRKWGFVSNFVGKTIHAYLDAKKFTSALLNLLINLPPTVENIHIGIDKFGYGEDDPEPGWTQQKIAKTCKMVHKPALKSFKLMTPDVYQPNGHYFETVKIVRSFIQ